MNHELSHLTSAMTSRRNDVVWLNNPFDYSDVDTAPVRRGQSIQQWLDDHGGMARLNKRPTVCVYKGRQLMRSEYATTPIDAPVCFVTLPQGGDSGSNPLALLAMLALAYFAGPAAMAMAGTTTATAGFGTFMLKAGIMIAGGMLINAVLPPPGLPAGASPSAASPTYSIGAQGNAARLSAPIPVNYGRMRIYPEFAAQPYTEFEGNEQFLYQLLCVGEGEHRIPDIKFEDTNINNFDEVSIQIVKPFQKVTLFPSAVVTAAEAGGQELNDASTVGPFRVNAIDTECSRIGVDLVFPAGLIGVDTDDGDEYSVGVHVRITAQAVDDTDNIVGDTIVIADTTISRCTRTPVRLSLSKDVPPGQYQVTVQRITGQAPSNVSANMQLGSVRGYLVDDNEYGDLTLIAMRVRATDNISNNASRMVNCIYERYLHIWHPDHGWSEQPVLTRNPVWAFADVIRARYGADMADSVLDLPELYQLAHICDERGDEFNGRFDSESNVWEALCKIGQVCRSAPVRQGNLIRLVRDQKQVLPVAQFGMSKMKNFSMDFVMHNSRTADSVKVTYWDEAKNYKQQTVLCQLPGENADNPKEVTLFGVTNRAQAYREGMLLAATNKLRRIPVSWETEMDGYIPSFLDVVLVNHDLLDPENMVSGQVMAASDTELLLSRDVALSADKNWYASFTDIYGAPVGPVRVEQGSRPNSIYLIDTLPDGFYLVTDADDERTHFMIGAGKDWCRRIKITGITPQSDDAVKISGVIEDDDVHDVDQGVVPDPLPDVGLPSPAPGKVSDILLTQGGTVTAPVIHLSWKPAPHSEKYHIEVSTDGRQTWQPAGTGLSYVPEHSYTAQVGQQTVRIAGLGSVRGEWTYVDLDAGSNFDVPPAVQPELAAPFTGPTLMIQWPDEPTAAWYQLQIVSNGNPVRSVTYKRSVRTHNYNYTEAKLDGVGRAFTVRLRAMNANEVAGPWSELAVNNPKPEAPADLVVTPMMDGFVVTCNRSSDPDVRELRVWIHKESGFVPDPGNLVAAADSRYISITASGSYYMRVAWIDLWGEDCTYSTEIHASTADLDFGEIEDQLTDLDDKISIVGGTIGELETEVEGLHQRLETVQATADGNKSTVQEHATAIATVKDGVEKLEASWGVTLDVNGYCSGFAMNNDGDTSSALFRADTFAVGSPGVKALTFVVQNGAVMMPGVSIQDGSLTANKLNVSTLSAISANLGVATAGTFKTNPSTGARVEISSSGDLPLWIGEGSVSTANASMYYQKSTKKLVARNLQSERMTATDLTCTRGNFKSVTVQGTIHGESGYFKGTIYADKIQGDVPNVFVFKNTARRFYHTWGTLNEFSFTQARAEGRFILIQSPVHNYFSSTDWRVLWNGQEVAYQRFGNVESIVMSVPQSTGKTGKLTIQMKTWVSSVYKDFPSLDGWLIMVGYNTGSIRQH